MTHNTKENKNKKTKAMKKNNTINLILTLNYYASSHKNRGQEQLGIRDTSIESSNFSVLI